MILVGSVLVNWFPSLSIFKISQQNFMSSYKAEKVKKLHGHNLSSCKVISKSVPWGGGVICQMVGCVWWVASKTKKTKK